MTLNVFSSSSSTLMLSSVNPIMKIHVRVTLKIKVGCNKDRIQADRAMPERHAHCE